jgi:hypothetical protein
MARVRISREEIDLIVKAADRIAERMHARFVVDHDKVEIVEDKPPKDADQQPPEGAPLNT